MDMFPIHKWKTETEELASVVLSEAQYLAIRNLMFQASEDKVLKELIYNNKDAYIAEQEYLRGQITAYKHILDRSDAAIEALTVMNNQAAQEEALLRQYSTREGN